RLHAASNRPRDPSVVSASGGLTVSYGTSDASFVLLQREEKPGVALMRTKLIGAAVFTLLLWCAAPALSQPAAVEFEWTPEHERGVYSRVTRERVRTPPRAGFNVEVGAGVPEDVELYDMPADIEYAPVRRYRYTVHENRVYVVDPSNRKVVRVIRR